MSACCVLIYPTFLEPLPSIQGNHRKTSRAHLGLPVEALSPTALLTQELCFLSVHLFFPWFLLFIITDIGGEPQLYCTLDEL